MQTQCSYFDLISMCAYISPTYIYTCVHSAHIWSLYPCMHTFFLPHQPISIHADPSRSEKARGLKHKRYGRLCVNRDL
ncbi:hypothetical protein SCLCIDRAFT_770424 [Scleroderma citrinum Foug A]|uniref:Uncharacterized protein n=1 Tax=Scleroderma citrinum Foug A TaxID=1036808 RepID=A0A0C2YKJ3_9AGAM|nr:hypothetical protein SCLCIDRAFT_916696 [Scleroderma citrinum Foug A]KIM50681.1 hypothetical protein SCLCIDRAFT_770424 [Scleroderma citrinum Foug A]